MIDTKHLHSLLKYDQKTGDLFWKPRERELFKTKQAMNAWHTKYSGKKAGSRHVCTTGKSYIQINISGKLYKAHRIIMSMLGFNLTNVEIDHIDGNECNNSRNNLRVVSHAENHKNHCIHKNNTSGTMGVSWDKRRKRWAAYIVLKGTKKHIGRYADKEEAVKARRQAEIKYGFHPSHGVKDSEVRQREAINAG